MMQSKIDYYLSIAKIVASQSKCTHRRFGAVIVKDDAIISTGYNGSVRGVMNCGTDCQCLKDVHDEPNNKDGLKSYLDTNSTYNFCPAVHGEMNAIINAARVGISVVGATMFVAEATGKSECPCYLCRRFIIQAGIKDVYDGFPEKFSHYFVVNKDFINLENNWIRDREHV
jgi:dCMP deaminase